jgi:ribosomal protein S18 acetylase RimI-like enzyme
MGKIKEIVTIYKRYITNEGASQSFNILFSRFSKLFISYKVAYVFKLNFSIYKWDQNSFSNFNDVEIKQLIYSDIEEVIHAIYMTKDEIITKIKNGQKCFLLYKNKELSGYLWVTEKPEYVSEIDYMFPTPEDDFYMYNVRILRGFRGAGLGSFFLNNICNELQCDSKSILSVVMKDNESSNIIFKKAGFERVEKIRYFKFLFIKKFITKILN